MTCRDCLHWEACKHMLEAMGHTVDGVGENADKRCNDFADKPRYIELPCKIGDVVWANRHFHGCLIPQEGTISEMYFTQDMKLQIVVKYVGRGIWGKTVFPTREAAEEAIKEKENV